MNRPLHLASALLLLFHIAEAAEFRQWTNSEGRKIEARMVEIQGDSIVLELKNGQKTQYSIQKLSKEDVEYTRQQVPAETTPPPVDIGLNFDSPWPDRIKFTEDPEIAIIEENADKKRYVYESANYQFTCDARLSKSVVKSFAVLFEATYLFCRTLPLAIDGGKTEGKKLPIALFEKFDDYVKAGAPPQSAGVYIGASGIVMVPLTSLGVEQVGRRYIVDRSKSSKTLPHELTHQLTPPAYYRKAAMGWFSEGLAEYIAVTPYKSGAFSVKNNHPDIIDYVTGYGSNNMGGRALGNKIQLPPLKAFMLQNYDSFLANPQVNYGSSLLIAYYFLQMDRDGDAARIKNFLKGLRQGKSKEQALDVLLDGQSFNELEKDIAKAWGSKRVDITFDGPIPSSSSL